MELWRWKVWEYIVWAVKHFRPYLYGHKCEVYIDHQAFQVPHEYSTAILEVGKKGMAIQELISHRAGHTNANSDALSRSPVTSGYNSNGSMHFEIIVSARCRGE